MVVLTPYKSIHLVFFWDGMVSTAAFGLNDDVGPGCNGLHKLVETDFSPIAGRRKKLLLLVPNPRIA